MITKEIETEFNKIFDVLSSNLDITASQYDKAVTSYQAVGKWLADRNSKLAPYSPDILPQGSFLLGTMIKPVLETDELDVDLVCRLAGKKSDWTQFDLKDIIGKRLKENDNYKRMLDDEGRRCWTLNYSDSFNYHMDILPSIVSSDYKIIIEKAFSLDGNSNLDNAAIRITDNQKDNYFSEQDPSYWNKSNPFGYAVWFQDRCSITLKKAMFLSEAVNPIPKFQQDKLPLQRVIQILKRHRDIMFKGDEDKPISIIITTLSAKAYKKETDITIALVNIVNNMESLIEEKYSPEHGKVVKWISNPVNTEENFADKWAEDHQKQLNFYRWIERVKSDLNISFEQKGIHRTQETFSKSFGESLSKATFGQIADQAYNLREKQNLYMSKETGNLSSHHSENLPVKDHHFHGYE